MLAMLPLKVMSLLLIPLAPLPYWALGLPWCVGADRRRIPLAPLVGCALAGFYAELGLILGLSPGGTVGVLTIASAAWAWVRARDAWAEVRQTAHLWLGLYFLSVVASSVSPFPIVGNWGGDWYLLYQMGASVMHGALPNEMLARPPLFGAATAPLWLLGPGLIPYQMMSAVAAASTVMAVLFFVDFFWPDTPRWSLLPLLLSPFFLHNTAAAWGKPLAGGLILAAIIEARRARTFDRTGGTPWASALLFALAVAVHEGSIIWAPCVLVAYATGWRGALRAVAALAVAGLVIVCPLLLWVLLKYGLAAKVASNPALTAHNSRNQQPFAIKTAMVVLTTFIGWEPVVGLARWMRNPQRLSGVVIVKESFWFITSWITTLAGTMLGILFPFVLCWRRLKAHPIVRGMFRSPVLLSLAFALGANGALCGYFSTEGSMQTGLVALGLGAYGLLAGAVASEGATARRDFRSMSWLMGLVGTLPWVMTNLTIAAGLWLSPGFRAQMRAGTEGDYARILAEQLHPLGLAAFPEVPLVAAVLLVGTLWSLRRATVAPSRQPGVT